MPVSRNRWLVLIGVGRHLVRVLGRDRPEWQGVLCPMVVGRQPIRAGRGVGGRVEGHGAD